ncbi:MAG: CusA/CzcA family heavy metal efflux RND transporter [Gemmataceae bacterium]|nr:CusA/CzcA family heavy metal efflux RND transporter [Gemmataceae bacterium]
MLNAIIDFSLRNRLLVILGTVLLAALGVLALRRLAIDAFPDTTPVQVQINTVAPALGPQEVERQITAPVEQAISGLPRLEELRSLSQFGLSQVVATFEDGTDIYFARQLLNERLSTVRLPAGIERPKLGPVATGLGEVFHYVVTGKGYNLADLSEEERARKLTELRTVHDWVIRPQLRKVRGVAEVNSWGGYEQQFQVRIHPDRLIRHGVTFEQVARAIEENNRNVGGGHIRRGSQMLLVQGVGRLTSLEEIRSVVVTAHEGVPILVRDVADVEIGPEVRRGAITADGKGEVVLGLGFMLMGENSNEIASALREKLKEVSATLPSHIKVEPVYDRTELVGHVIHTVRNNLFEAGLLVIAVLFLFLGNLRAALIVALAIPLSLLFAFSGMLRFGIAASLLSLGAIDFGMIVDSSVVMVENCVRHLANGGKSKLDAVREAAVEVRKPTLFGELIIMIVYLPILTLEGIEGKMFRPMALTVIFALAGSMILSLTLMPVLASLLLPGREREAASGPGGEPLVMRIAHAIHAPLLRFALRYKTAVLLIAVALLGLAGILALNMDARFVPRLQEGAVTLEVTRPSGTDLDESVRLNTQMEKAILKEFPDEVAHVWSRIGTAEVATDPMGVEMIDTFITLKPREQWTRAATQEELEKQLKRLVRQFPAQNVEYFQPIEQRVNEMISGEKADVVVKLFGDDLKMLMQKGEEIAGALRKVDGSANVTVKQISGQPVLRVKVKRDQLARYRVPARAVLDLVESVGSYPLGEVVEGEFRFPLVARLPEKLRKSPETLAAIELTTPTGERIPLGRLATFAVLEDVPSRVLREWGRRYITVTLAVEGREVGSFVAAAQRKVAQEVSLPPGRYHIEWGGQYEHLVSARQRLLIVVPVALLLIFVLLYMTYGNMVDSLRVFTAIPFAAVGGIIALWLRGMPFSISAGIGFIALSGVAVLDDMILVSYIRQLRARGMKLEEAVTQAAVTRLRPVLMTTLVASLGFLPMAFSTGMGAEVQRPLATVVVGGLLTSMIMSLLVVRVLYLVFQSPTETPESLGERGA